MEIAIGAVISDRFVVLGRIGSGAVAIVYLVRHLQLGSLHAIKVLQIPTPFVRTRLLREGQLQSTLKDPHVVSVTDVVEIDGVPGLVMDFVRGPSLDKLLQHVRFDIDQAIAIGAGILAGMRTAHQAGMIHRDLKPANVLIDVTDTQLVPKIADFGLAKLLSGDDGALTATRTGSTLGTPAYMAPEQIRDARNVDERADVFALGAILYEIITGHRAFPGDDLLDLFDRIREGKYVPIHILRPEVPPWLVEVIEAALATHRDDRIGSVAELYDRWTQGRLELAAEIDWPPALISLAADLTPKPQAQTLEKLPSGATFDLSPNLNDNPALAETLPEGRDGSNTLTPAPESNPLLDSALGLSNGNSLGEQRGFDTSSFIVTDPTRPTPEPAPPSRSRRPPFATAAVLVSVSVSVLLMCAGFAGVIGIGLFAGVIQAGPKLPPRIADPVSRPVYSPAEVPRASDDPAIEARHQAAWLALREGRFRDALSDLEDLSQETGPDALGLQLLTATAEIGIGEPAGYKRIDQLSDRVVGRRGPLADLVRIAADALQAGPDPALAKRHQTQWPEDELALLLLAQLDGWESERRLEFIESLRSLDPDSAGPVLLLVHYWLDRSNLVEARAVLDAASQKFTDNTALTLAQARWLLLSGRPQEARVLIEGLSGRTEPNDPSSVRLHAAALRELGDIAALDAIYDTLTDDRRVEKIAFAQGRSEAAFGLGQIEEALQWLQRGFEEATSLGRFDDASEIARTHQQFAALLARESDLSAALDTTRRANSLPSVPNGLGERLVARIELLEGLLALTKGDAERAQRAIERLETAERGERLAAVLRSAALAKQGKQSSDSDLPTGCAGRMIGAQWRALSQDNEVDSVFRSLATEDTPCARSGIDRYIRADAESYLAKSAILRRDFEDAQRHIDAARVWMPQADLGSPVRDRLSEAEEAIATRPL